MLILLIWLSSKERSAPADIILVRESKTKRNNHNSCTSKDRVLSSTKLITSENFCLESGRWGLGAFGGYFGGSFVSPANII